MQRTNVHYMAPRIKRLRKIIQPPVVKGFKPYGVTNTEQNEKPIILLYEEYEAIRLCDYKMYNHLQASEIINISRPTFTRIYASARQKIAKAFAEGREIKINGGNVYYDSPWYHCNTCSCYFNNPNIDDVIRNCPLCGSRDIVSDNFSPVSQEKLVDDYDDYCICPNCGYEKKHEYGEPCNKVVCPQCNSFMRRKKFF